MTKLVIPTYQKEDYNYAIEKMGVKSMWERAITGKNITVAIIDTGCDVNHQELKENIVGVYNFTSDNGKDTQNVTDYLGHGTHVAGIIGSKNNIHLVGVAPDVSLLILKTIGESGSGSTELLINAIQYAVDWEGENGEKVDVINMSLGTPVDNPGLREVVELAIQNNIILVAAAGNDGDGNGETNEINYPGFYEGVFEIGATDIEDKPAYFTNSNVNVDYVAPGKNIYSTFPNNKFATLSGTSMATPQASGVIALIKDYYRATGLEITDKTINDYLLQKSEYLPEVSSNIQGFGLIKI